jgi:PAS domain S-box-containing protein
METFQALIKIVLFDMGLALETYIFSDQQAIVTLKNYAEQILDSLPVGVAILSPDMSLISVNRSFKALFQLQDADLTGIPLGSLLPVAGLSEWLSVSRPARAPAWHGFSFQAGEDRGECHCRMTVTPILSDEKEAIVRQWLLIAEDITDLKRSEADLAHRAKELERSNKALAEFAYVASHDLQEPLRMVSSYTQLLAKRYQGKLDQDADEFIAYAVEGATRMQELIHDLLEYSRVDIRQTPFEILAVSSAFLKAMANLQSSIQTSGAVVTSDPLPTVKGDPGQLTQLFQNLIGNAIKFRGTECPRIHVAAGRQGDNWIVSVSDNGLGIEPEYAERIFEVFQRLHVREDYPGTGIGLAICRKVVQRHGGRIWVDSRPGPGSTFTFTLPAIGALPK